MITPSHLVVERKDKGCLFEYNVSDKPWLYIPEAPKSKVLVHNTSSFNHHPYSSEEHMVEFSTGQKCKDIAILYKCA